jgi:hypothetical protein
MKYPALLPLIPIAVMSCQDQQAKPPTRPLNHGPVFSNDYEQFQHVGLMKEEHTRLSQRLVESSPETAPKSLNWNALGSPPNWAIEVVTKKLEKAAEFEGIIEFGSENIRAWDATGKVSVMLRDMAIQELEKSPGNRSFKSKYGWRTLVALFKVPQNTPGPLPPESFTFAFEQLGGASPFVVGPTLDSECFKRVGVPFLARSASKSATIPFFVTSSWFSGPFSLAPGSMVKGKNVELKVSRVENLLAEDQERAKRMARYPLRSKVVFDCVQSTLSSSAFPPYVNAHVVPKLIGSKNDSREFIDDFGNIYMQELSDDPSEQELKAMFAGQSPTAMFTSTPVTGKSVELWRNFKVESVRNIYLIENAVVHLEVQIPLHGAPSLVSGPE